MNETTNYYLKFLKTIEKIKPENKPKLLLHSCCAPCSSYSLELLMQYFNVDIFYFNPNITDTVEYKHRLSEQKSFIKKFCPRCKVIEGEYKRAEFYESIKGLEHFQEGGLRCEKCFRLRLLETALKAKELEYDYFATTLSVSPYKNAQILNKIGESVARSVKVKYLCTDLKKNDGYKRSIEISNQYGLYRQSYCGCEFSH